MVTKSTKSSRQSLLIKTGIFFIFVPNKNDVCNLKQNYRSSLKTYSQNNA